MLPIMLYALIPELLPIMLFKMSLLAILYIMLHTNQVVIQRGLIAARSPQRLLQSSDKLYSYKPEVCIKPKKYNPSSLCGASSTKHLEQTV